MASTTDPTTPFLLEGTPTVNSYLEAVTPDDANVQVLIEGTWSGVVLEFEKAVKSGVHYIDIPLADSRTGRPADYASANCCVEGKLRANSGFRVRARGTVMVGTASITITYGGGSSVVSIGAVTTDQSSHGLSDLVAADITKVGGAALSLGQKVAATSLPVVLPALQVAGAANIANSQATVDSTTGGDATTASPPTRRRAVVTNLGTVDVWLGTGTVSSSNGQLLTGVKGTSVEIKTTAAIKGIAASSQAVSVLEEYD